MEQSELRNSQRLTKEKIKYDNSTTVICPSCGEDMHIGMAGPASLGQHEAKGPCHKAQAIKEQKKKTRTLFDVGVKKVKDILPSTSTASSSRNKGPSPIKVLETESHQSKRQQGTIVQEGQEC